MGMSFLGKNTGTGLFQSLRGKCNYASHLYLHKFMYINNETSLVKYYPGLQGSFRKFTELRSVTGKN